MRIRKGIFCLIAFCMLLLHTQAVAATAPETENLYMTGYIKSMLKEKYNADENVAVRSGEVFLPDTISTHPQYEAIIQSISGISGVKTIKLVAPLQLNRIQDVWLFDLEPLMKPLKADPRWPQFSAGLRAYTIDSTYDHSFDASFGTAFSVLRWGLGENRFTEIGVHAGVFSDFNMDRSTFILVNSDFLVGLPITFAWDSVTVMGRVYHQSSHLGDEFMEKNPEVERIELQYEAVDALVSFEPTDYFRLYGGGGWIFRRTPDDFGRWLYQFGAELRVVPDSSFIPVTIVALDVKGAEETDYVPAWSVMVGLEVKRNIVASLEFFDGHSPKGQFYDDKVQWFGIGIHIY